VTRSAIDIRPALAWQRAACSAAELALWLVTLR